LVEAHDEASAVNESLLKLLRPPYDGELAPEHLTDLRRSGLTDETIAAQMIRSVPPAMFSQLLGFDVPSVRSAMLFPFRSPAGGFMDHIRVKIFPSLVGAGGQGMKYLQPKGSTQRLYFVAPCLDEVLVGTSPLWFVEGEKKALAAYQQGLSAVGICGVEGWHSKGSNALLPDFDHIRLDGRAIKLLPDGDYHTNPNVRQAIERFAEALRERGALPRLKVLPRELPA
jgi:hypothetical protein